jgi:hypothetical protein
MASKEEFYEEAKKYGQCVLANLNEMLAKLTKQQCVCGHLRSQHSAGVWSCLERGENGWCMCTKFEGIV